MPYADPFVRAAYKLAHSQLPAQRERQRTLRAQATYPAYINPIRRKSRLMRRYGITPDDYDRMLADQKGKCALCDSERPKNGRGDHYFDVDHDHATGAVRGLLCRQCNIMISAFENNLNRLPSIAAYLKLNIVVDHGEYDPKGKG